MLLSAALEFFCNNHVSTKTTSSFNTAYFFYINGSFTLLQQEHSCIVKVVMSERRTSMLIFIYAIIIIAFLDTFIQLPIIAPYATELGASSFLTGMIIAIYSLSNMIGNAISGHWIDRYGRKKMLLFGMGFVAVALLFYPLAQSGWGLFWSRLFHGLAGGALIPAAFAYLGDLAPSRRRGKTMAFSGACIGTAAIIGPAFGGIMSARLSVDTIFYFVAVLFFITGIVAFIWLKESSKSFERKAVDMKDILPLLRNPIMLQALISAFALMMSMGVLAYALPLKVESLSLSTAVTGLLLSSFGIVALIIFLSPLNRLFDRYSPSLIILIGMGLISFSLISLSQLQSIEMIAIIMLIYGVGFSFIFPSMNRMVLDISTSYNRGKAFGLFYACFSLGVVFGSSFSGAISDAFGQPLFISGLIMVGLALTFFILFRNHHQSLQPKMH
ncbi:MFS transporter [Evansella sp. AB-P1]|nr:MFS transporter [Evansella sp. AB-P1]MDG5789946.1 MFS transporter [Evansella sp. AB-P1]